MKKKLNNILLEAINRGINLALDSFEDDNIQQLTHGNIKSSNISAEYCKLLSLTVDLGLPSGTLWFKYNIGVNPETAKTNEDWYGNYYAWGEIEEKPYGVLYTWKNYKFGKEDELTKYNINNANVGYFKEESEIVLYIDNLTLLEPEDDIATLIYGKGYHIPTIVQWKELIENTEISVDYRYLDLYNNRAFILTSKINGNKIYLPATGYKNSSGYNGYGSSCCYWTSSLNKSNPNRAWRLAIRGDGVGKAAENMSICERANGFTIRPVYS